MKLKDLLSESSLKVLDRKFGEPLPTLEDTTKAYALKKEMVEGGPGSGPQPEGGSAKGMFAKLADKFKKKKDEPNTKKDSEKDSDKGKHGGEASASDKAMAMKGLSNLSRGERLDFEDEYDLDTTDDDQMQNFIGGLQNDELDMLKTTYLKKNKTKQDKKRMPKYFQGIRKDKKNKSKSDSDSKGKSGDSMFDRIRADRRKRLGMESVNERKFGEPLPTLEDTTRAYALKNQSSSLLKDMVKENKNKDLLKVATTLGKTPSDVNSFLKKYDLEPDDLLDIIETGGRRYSLAIIAAMKGNNRALRQLDNLLGFL